MFLCIEPFPPPTDFQLMEANHTHLSFNWTQVSLNCQSLQYIVASNCGECPSTTDNKVTCTGNYTQLINTDSQCSFTVQTVVCNDSIVGDISTAINVTMTELGIRSTSNRSSTLDTMCTQGLYISIIVMVIFCSHSKIKFCALYIIPPNDNILFFI